MPSTYAHYCFADQVKERLSEPVREVIRGNERLFLIGAQGPDLFFYHYPLFPNQTRKIGSQIHKKPVYQLIAHGRKVILKKGDPEQRRRMKAYLLGVITHFLLDHACHPYIEKVQAEGEVIHSEIEGAFERYLLMRDSLDVRYYNPAAYFVSDAGTASAIAPFYGGASVAAVMASLSGLKRYNQILLVKTPSKRKLFIFLKGVLPGGRDLYGHVIPEEDSPLFADSNVRMERKMQEILETAPDYLENVLAYVDEDGKLDGIFKNTFNAGDHWQEIDLATW